MKIRKNTIPILFGAGAYGTFVEWCLNYFSGEDVVVDPFKLNGNSHRFVGNHFLNLKGWRDYVNSDYNWKFVRFHPKTEQNDSVIETAEEVLLSVEKAVILYHDDSLTLLAINNKFDKIWEEGWLVKTSENFDYHFKNWNKTSLNDMSIWELREFLSLFIFKQHKDEFQNDQVSEYQNEKIKKVNLKSLFNDFENTIKDLLLWCKLDLVKDNFNEIYETWISKQQHRHKDEVVLKIINSVLGEQYYDWSNQKLSIVDEAFIQMSLRDLHNLDLRCYNLNVFPTNTKDLKELLFDV